MIQGQKATFRQKEKLYLLMNLRIEGYSMDSLASLFHCDRKAVAWQCRKYGVMPAQPVFSVPAPEFPRERVFLNDGERINIGKRSYADYLRAYSPTKGSVVCFT